MLAFISAFLRLYESFGFIFRYYSQALPPTCAKSAVYASAAAMQHFVLLMWGKFLLRSLIFDTIPDFYVQAQQIWY